MSDDRIAALEEQVATLQSELQKARVDADTRAAALHLMLAQLYRQQFVMSQLTDDQVTENNRKMVALLEKYVPEGLDPAMSDHVADEITYWVREILNDAVGIRKRYQQANLPG